MSQVVNTYANLEWELRLVRVYRVKLLHGYCFNILREAYWDSLKIQLIDICCKLKREYALLPPKYCIDSSKEDDEITAESMAIIKDIRSDNTVRDIFAIPTTEEILSIESYSAEEMEEMMRAFNGLNFRVTKSFQKELDSVVHPSEDYSSSDAHHQPHFTQAEDLEFSIKEMFRDYKDLKEQSDYYDYSSSEKDYNIFAVNTFHKFDGCYEYNTFMFKALLFYSMMYRIFKLEYFISKSTSNPINILDLEKYVFNNANYWKMIENEEGEAPQEDINFEIYSDSEDSRVHENTIAKSIIKKIVNERRKRVKLQDDLENLYESMNFLKDSVAGLQETTFPSVLEYLSLYHENRFMNAVYCVNQCLDKLYTNEIPRYQEPTVMKQIDSLQGLYKHLLNREERFEKWYNNRFLWSYIDKYPTRGLPNKKFEEQPYLWLDIGILDISKEARANIYASSNSLKGFINDYLNIFKLSNKKDSANLRERNDLVKNFVIRNQLKFALFSWYSMEDYPLTPRQHSILLLKFKDDLFKKIYTQKKVYLKSIEGIVGENKLDMTNEDSLSALNPIEKEKMKMERVKAMSKYTLVELVSQTKSEIIVIRDEIDRLLLIYAIDIIEREYAGLSSALDSEASQISAYIHSFQQFSSVCFPTVDKYSHLDMVNKVSAVQKCLTRLKNRWTEVETLTSGPGIVFTIKDFNECIQMLCRDLIKYSEIELRSRSETASLKENHLLHLVYIKDKMIQNLEYRIQNAKKNMDMLISAYLYDHGNKIIYELDVSKRQVRTFKDNIYKMEEDLRDKIKSEYQNTIKRNLICIESTQRSFQDFKTDISTKIKADILQEQQKIEKTIKQKAFEYKKINIEAMKNQNADGGMDPEKYWEAIDNAKKAQADAIKELADLSEQMRKNEDGLKLENVKIREKMQEKINTMKRQLTENKSLWQQLAEAEKRESILKQELVFTQQCLTKSEKANEMLKEELKKVEAERLRLSKYKANKTARLQDLEGKVRSFEVLGSIDLNKLLEMLMSKEQKIQKLKYIENLIGTQIEEAINQRHDKDMAALRKKLNQESKIKQEALEKLEVLKEEIKSLESGNANAVAVRSLKQICKEFQINNEALKYENATLKKQLENSMMANSVYNIEETGSSFKKSKLLRETGRFVGDHNSNASVTKNSINFGNILNKLDRSMDSSKMKKGGTPQLAVPATKSSNDSNYSNAKKWKVGNVSVHRKQESSPISMNEVEKFQTPGHKQDLNLTFSKGQKLPEISKMPRTTKKATSVSKNTTLKEILGRDFGAQMISPSNQRE